MTASSADTVSIDWCHTVRCATDLSWKELESPISLGPLDQLVDPTIPVAVVFVYEQASTSSDALLIPLERLERSMSLLLDHYPHLSGRLQFKEHDGTPEIARLGTGVHLFAARCSERLDAFQAVGHGRIMSLPGAGNALLAPFDATIDGVRHEPMFTIQHTRFSCGSVALGIRVLHKLCDADGFFQLVRDLAELYRSDGTSTFSHPPHYRSYLSGFSEEDVTPEEKEAILTLKPPLFYLESAESTSVWASTAPPSVPPPPTIGRFIRFSTPELNALKSAATDPARPGSWVSTFEALSAHIYQHVHRARLRLRQEKDGTTKYGELSPTDFLTPLNLRSRLGPECFPPKYFPNALICTYTQVPPDVLANGPLHEVASILHDLTRNPPGLASEEDIVRTNKWVALQSDKRKIRQGFRYGTGSFMISQWNKFDMYESTVFDRPPTLVSPPFTPISLVDGLVYFLPSEDRGAGADQGAIDVVLALSGPTWEFLDQDKEFRRFRE